MKTTLIKTHRGGYKTMVAGVEVEIEKQYGRRTWVAQSVRPMSDGEYIDIECETLRGIRHDLAVVVMQNAALEDAAATRVLNIPGF